jgi:hypothetical protein
VEGQDKDYYNLTSCQNWAYREVCRIKDEVKDLQKRLALETVSRLCLNIIDNFILDQV